MATLGHNNAKIYLKIEIEPTHILFVWLPTQPLLGTGVSVAT